MDATPRRRLAVIACMDARLNVDKVLGLREGDAHVIRNAGGLVTDDAIRSLAISQRMLETNEIILIHHTDCGLSKFTDDEFRDQVEQDSGERPPWPIGTFTDVDADVRESIARLRASPFVPKTHAITGYVYDVETGQLNEVS
jgi:carbonic anhydrase